MADVPNKTAELFKRIAKIGFIFGLPNTWIQDLPYPDTVKRFYRVYRPVTTFTIIVFMIFEWVALYTQNDLTEKQRGDLVMFSMSHPILFTWIAVAEWHTDRIKNLNRQVAVVLKEVYNDQAVEDDMVRKVKFSGFGYSGLFMMALIFYGYDSLVQVIRGEGTFTTVITFWPDVHDRSALAAAARIGFYLHWWVFMSRVCCVYVAVLAILVALSYQFRNVQSYFHSLEEIWSEDLDQEEKERKYEAAFKVGVRMHSQTLWCTKECQSTYGVIFSCQVFMVISVLVSLMAQMVMTERTLESVLSIVTTGGSILSSNAFFMWNAGDITVEAAGMPTALYGSGWQRCRRSARRVRSLVVITMTQAQTPVKLWAFGIVELSYGSYVSIVKSSYSVFSVLY